MDIGGAGQHTELCLLRVSTTEGKFCAILTGEMSKHDRSVYALCRIVLDEAHSIRNKRTSASQACCSLQGEARWCLTGTPNVNSANDAFALFKFTRYRCVVCETCLVSVPRRKISERGCKCDS